MNSAPTTASWLDISKMAARYGVSLRTLRFYEAQGLLYPLRQGTSRFYSRQDCIRLEIILKGKKLGFSLREIDALIGQGRTNGEEDERPLIDRMTSRRLMDQIEALSDRRKAIDLALPELEAALSRVSETSSS